MRCKERINGSEDGIKETYWKYVADNVLLDDTGQLNKHLNSSYNGIKGLNQTSFYDENFPKASKTVRFDDRVTQLPSDDTGLRGESIRSKAGGSQSNLKGAGGDKVVYKSQFVSDVKGKKKIEAVMEEDEYFNELEYRKEKKRLLERFWSKTITVG
jgi:hypothetical protein